MRTSSAGRRLSWLRLVLASLGGADTRILAKAPVDAAEMTGRGIAALIPAVFGGLAALISFRYAYSLPLPAAAAAGAGWAVVVLCFDLSLMTTAPDRQRAFLAVTFGSRAIVSVLAAFTFASAIVMFMFATDISTQVAKDQQIDLAHYNAAVIIPAYAKRISADQGTITTGQNRINQASQVVAGWQQKVAGDRVQVTCEAHGVTQFAGCGHGTGLVGQGQVYDVRLTELRNDQASLASAQAQATAIQDGLSPQIAAAQADLSQARVEQKRDYAQAQARYRGNDGLIARWRALGELESHSPGIRLEVWLLEGLIIAIDLAAVIAKLTSKTPSYNRLLEASRKKVVLRAAMEEENAHDRTELRRAERQAASDIKLAWLDAKVHVALAGIAAWTRVAEQNIQAWEATQTAGIQNGTPAGAGGWQPPPWAGPGGWQPPQRRAANDVPAKETSLTDLVKKAQPHHRMAVTMAGPLRRVAWIGVGLLAALGAALLLADTAHATVAGGWLVAAALTATLALAIYSRGFRRGPAWAHRAAFGTGLLGLALPVVIVLANV
jgi:hypothetical protein